MTKKNRLTLERHQQLGTELYAMHERFCNLEVELGNVYPFSNKGYIRAGKALQAIDQLRSAMDDNLFRDVLGSKDELGKVYYPGPSKNE